MMVAQINSWIHRLITADKTSYTTVGQVCRQLAAVNHFPLAVDTLCLLLARTKERDVAAVGELFVVDYKE
jgi:hypothetical protein